MRCIIATTLALACLISLSCIGYAAEQAVPEPVSTVKLTPPRTDGGISVEKALATRRSVRTLDVKPVSLEMLSQLLWAAQGVTDDKSHRTAPSARAVYSLETYVVSGNVIGLAAGVYKYVPAKHELKLLTPGDKRSEMVKKTIGQSWIESAPAIVVLSGVADRVTRKNGEKNPKWMYVEAGLAAENYFLQAVSLGLSSTFVGGFDTDALRSFLSLPATEEPVAVLPIGYKK